RVRGAPPPSHAPQADVGRRGDGWIGNDYVTRGGERRPMRTGAQLLVERLKAHGVDTIFGIPGIHNLAIYDALIDEPGVRVVTTRDERGAGHMADGHARATGRPGVCLTVPGPGVTNALTAVGEAYADSSPVLVLATQLSSATVVRDREDFHQLRDTQALLPSRSQWGVPPARAPAIGPARDA